MKPLGRSVVILSAVALIYVGYRISEAAADGRRDHSKGKSLTVITMEYGANANFELDFFSQFGKETGIPVNALPPTETVKSRLVLYQELLSRHATEPDLYEIDVIWPSILAGDLIDLSPYFQKEISEIDPEVLNNFRVGGRLVAIPTFIDMGVLYYRPDLLRKYGYSGPPATWEQLQKMSTRIQAGERKAGKPNFWGYVWQGGACEALTCNALEWQASQGGRAFLGEQKHVSVNNPEMLAVLKRAVSWIGTISPPGEAYYREMDGMNLWNEGNAAFMRNWVSSYGLVDKHSWPHSASFRLAALPGGPGGQRSTLGGLGMGISKYSNSKEISIQALRGLTGAAGERRRALEAGTIPLRRSLRSDAEILAKTALPGKVADQVMRGLISRTALAPGATYMNASQNYFQAINSVLSGHAKPEQAMAELEAALAAQHRNQHGRASD